ncbi:MAG: hypothetical protein LWW83_09720 [Azonexaceae bacterium]|nr:hypothetical protein [Azonexaceae bacterium]
MNRPTLPLTRISPGAAMAHGCCGGFRMARPLPSAEIIHVDFSAEKPAGQTLTPTDEPPPTRDAES